MIQDTAVSVLSMPRGVREVAVDGELAAGLPPDVEVSTPSGVRRLPSFTGRDGRFRVRVRDHEPGSYEVRLPGADRPCAQWQVDEPVTPAGPLLRRSERRLVDHDGQPFFWLADTWWFALCDRVTPEELAGLAAQRLDQGFTVVQVVAGLLPEVEAFEDLGELGGRWPWTADFADLDPTWWDLADARLVQIVEAGLTPAVVGAWSYYLLELGPERMLRHWREVLARWSALPVVFCVAGEAGLPHYAQLDEPGLDEVVAELSAGWHRLAGEVRALDGYHNVLTAHPCPAFGHYSSTDALGSVEDLDLVWLQTGHADRAAIDSSLGALDRELAAGHGLPVINSEVCYEGIAAGSAATLQRFLFFSHLLSGAAGHTYGAQGLWAFRRAQDNGPGLMWGDATWQEAAALPGAAQLGRAATLLREQDWDQLVPAPDALSVHAGPERRVLPYAARSGDTLIAYFPPASLLPLGIGISQELREVSLLGLTEGEWTVSYWNPRHEAEPIGFAATVGPDGRIPLARLTRRSALPSMEDWVVLATPRR